MPSTNLSDEQLLQHLNQHPHLKHRIQMLIQVVEDAGDDLTVADEAERRLIEELRRMGQEAMEAWAVRQIEKTGAVLREEATVHLAGKKNSAGTRHLEPLK